MDNIDMDVKNFLNGLHEDVKDAELTCYFLTCLINDLIEEKKKCNTLFSSTRCQKAYSRAYNIALKAISQFLKEKFS